MNLVHTVATLRADHGGPSRSVPALCVALAARGESVHLVTTATEGALTSPGGSVRHAVVPPPAMNEAHRRRGGFVGMVEAAVKDGRSLLHDHGLWLPTNHAVARIGLHLRVPRVVSIRGMLSEWALRQRRLRKKFAWRLYQRADLASASAVHVTSESELGDIRRLRVRVPVAVIPNGVEVPPNAAAPADDGVNRALFLSRLHPGKGALDLVTAWAKVRPAGWHLTIAGPDVDGHRARLETAVRAAGLSGDVSFAGAVGEHEKWQSYQQSDLFVLPTRSENFGLVIAEALAAGVPVITTHGAPWRELETRRCGWWVTSGPDALVAALREATLLDSEARRQMGIRGRSLIEERYAWPRIADRMRTLYAWLLEGGVPPADVSM